MKTYSVALAGTTKRTKQVAESLAKKFSIPWILTPQPKKIGRKQILTKNPLHKFAKSNEIPVVLVNKKIDEDIKRELKKLPKPDFLLVVDFGFLVPKWLLDLPKQHPLNIHPSLLPRWRGSSPGQFVLLSGEKQSAVTMMVMNEKLDQGPILKQILFEVENHWTQDEYYQHSFDLACAELTKVIEDLATDELKPQPQPADSPTPTAGRLTKQDSFIEWELLKNAMEEAGSNKDRVSEGEKENFGPLDLPATPQNITNACRGFYPWPKLWTMMSGKRMIIHSCHTEINPKTEMEKLVLDEIQLEGKQKIKFSTLPSYSE